MSCWPDFNVAEEVVDMFKDKYLEVPPIDAPEKIFKETCDRRWAADDLLSYMRENWYEDEPSEVIVDYIEDVKYRAKKYAEHPIGKIYDTAKQTAENILFYFLKTEEDIENEYSDDSQQYRA